jgi:tRNA pseudouridine55 synthase
MASEKRYLAEIDLSRTSPTDDLEAETESVAVERPPDAARVREVCARFVGEIMQTPPVYSAIWVDGKRSYNLARGGEAAVLPARPVAIHSIDIVSFAWPMLTLDVRCGKGTYIRSLARDLGRALHTGGVLTALRRTASGEFKADGARDPRSITKGLEQSDLLDMPTASAITPDADADP